MSRWECVSGHILEGNFFSPPGGRTGNAIGAFSCPSCGADMILSGEEGALERLKRIREFIGEVSKNPRYETDSSIVMAEVSRLEFTIRKLAEEAARP